MANYSKIQSPSPSPSPSSPPRREDKRSSMAAVTKKRQLPPQQHSDSSKQSDSPCSPQLNAALKCLEDFKKDKNKCQGYFDKYKECMKKEKEATLEQNRGRGSLFS